MLLDDGVLGLFPFELEDSALYREWVNQEETARLLGRATPVTQTGHEGWYRSLVSRCVSCRLKDTWGTSGCTGSIG
jgi:hypothetical protein